MNLHSTTLPAALGAALAGGFFAGLINDGGKTFALIVAPKDGGERVGAWNGGTAAVLGAASYSDGAANTAAMGEAGSDLAKWARALTLAEHSDWYLPSRDELELVYRNLKPTARENYASFRDGDNPSSAPAGYPYTETVPPQTSAAAFRDGGTEALAPVWYWSSTQHASASSDAWGQYFSGGNQDDGHKSYEGRARAVRRFAI